MKKILLLFLTLVLLSIFSVPIFAFEEETKYRSDYEIEMLDYINEARQENGLAPLQMSEELIHIARLKSQDMINKNYFSHTSPTYGSPFEMMQKFGIEYNTAGENLAGHYSVYGAHTALMNSSGHRKNILNPSFTHVGIGIAEGGPYGMMFTQMFVEQPGFSDNTTEKQEKQYQSSNEKQSQEAILEKLINDERTKNGLSPLIINVELTKAAQMKADEMVEKNYLSYNSPQYGYMQDMLRTLNIPFQEVKENIVAAGDVYTAHNALMNSSRHKSIILNPELDEMGLGIANGGRYGLNIVEVFIKGKQGTNTPEPEPEPEPKPKPEPKPDTTNNEIVLEQELLKLINEERNNNGLDSLSMQEELNQVAFQKAKDMEEKGYLSYVSPTYGRTSDMLAEKDINYVKLGENIAAAYSINTAHKALMGYSRQKGNILSSDFQEVGLGVVKSNKYGYIIVEIFLGATNNNYQEITSNNVDKTVENNSSSLSQQEQKEYELLELVNKARREAGLQSLKMDANVVRIARLKSTDMIENNYFAHTSPTYGSPFEMMDKYGIDYRTAGENLAGHYSIPGAHEALMNSPGHRQNILNPNFTHIGIGIVEGGPYGLMITQMFVGY